MRGVVVRGEGSERCSGEGTERCSGERERGVRGVVVVGGGGAKGNGVKEGG